MSQHIEPAGVVQRSSTEDASTAQRTIRRRVLLAVGCASAVAVGVLAIVASQALTPSGDSGLVGERAPSLTLSPLAEGSPKVSLEDVRGRPAVINFWASWCVPCRREMPDLQAAHELLGDKVMFIGVVHADVRGAALDLAQETGVSYPSGFDPGGTVAASYGLLGLPTTVLVSADGRIAAVVQGAITENQLLQLVDARLGVTL